MNDEAEFRINLRLARKRWPGLTRSAMAALKQIIEQHHLSVALGDILYLDSSWYVTHPGLLRLAEQRNCIGVNVEPVQEFCEPTAQRWAFKATVFKSHRCKGFVGYGDADPSNVSRLCVVPRCESLRHARSIVPCAKHTESGSAPLKRSDQKPDQLRRCKVRRSFRRNQSMGMAGRLSPSSAIASASSFASTNWKAQQLPSN